MWGDKVEVVSCDMRQWNAPEKADILVSELLGSFGDNELSPECLDGAQRFLKGKKQFGFLFSLSAIFSFPLKKVVMVYSLSCNGYVMEQIKGLPNMGIKLVMGGWVQST